VPIADQIHKEIKDLRLNIDKAGAASQLTPIRIDHAVRKTEMHGRPSTGGLLHRPTSPEIQSYLKAKSIASQSLTH
jgi:hypothetical protein